MNAMTKSSATATDQPHWMHLLAVSEKGGRNYSPEVEGRVPEAIQGTLYRNGPGLFERGGVRKQGVLDGDGLVQALTFDSAGVRYRNAFVETPKFKAEKAASKYQHATWTTRRPGGPLRNLGGGDLISQAGVTVYPVNGKLIARDETGDSFVLDPTDLSLVETMMAGEPQTAAQVGYKAHSKYDPKTGEWLLVGQEFGPTMQLHMSTYDKAFRLTSSHRFAAPRQVYLHDFMVTEHYFIFVLHPCYISPLSFLTGFKSLTDGMRWKQADGNIVALYPRAGGEPQFFDAPGAFMWHALNAYEVGDEVIADFVGYDDPDHFIGDDPLVKALMEGRTGNAAVPGSVRRYRINPTAGVLKEEIIDGGTHEFPMLDERLALSEHTYGYLAYGGLSAANDGLKRLNLKTGDAQSFRFDGAVQVGEPIFVPKPGAPFDTGWLIAQCLDGDKGKSFFGIWDAETVDRGPISKIWLSHHAPISFHGAWSAA